MDGGTGFLLLLPLNCHAFSLVRDFLHRSAMDGLVYLALFHTEGSKCGSSCFSQVDVALIGFCTLQGLLGIETAGKHGKNLQEGLHWLNRLIPMNILWLCGLCCLVLYIYPPDCT